MYKKFTKLNNIQGENFLYKMREKNPKKTTIKHIKLFNYISKIHIKKSVKCKVVRLSFAEIPEPTFFYSRCWYFSKFSSVLILENLWYFSLYFANLISNLILKYVVYHTLWQGILNIYKMKQNIKKKSLLYVACQVKAKEWKNYDEVTFN